ncbi:MAG: FkbM family methyltransferase [Rhodocyclaceae bacterium]|nr:FkbM family methyltransferase [Rhodocyclaceae bacterium]MCB1963846.1 FkbM family methyltransferase [Rhodocyclaceae bacterium]
MSVRAMVSRLVPQSAKNFLRQRTLPWRISGLISPGLPTTVCVDVGASHYPHVRWLAFLNAPATQWLAVEPNEANLGYLKSWAWPCQVSACTTGLSQTGGAQTLHVTNVDTGSSLLPPEIPDSMKHRVNNLDYFFPVTERVIDTLTLVQAMAALPASAPVLVKLDTQGTELSILQGAAELFEARRIVGIEMESTLLAKPLMRGSGKFWQACEYLEGQGFELMHIKPIPAIPRSGRPLVGRNMYLNECDAVFALRRDVAAGLPVEYRACLLAFYLTYFFYEEAASMLDDDLALGEFLQQRGCALEPLKALVKAAS